MLAAALGAQTDWRRGAPSTSPPARSGNAMAEDPVRAEVVTFGGDNGLGAVLADTWLWRGTNWAPGPMPPAAPPARRGHALAWERAANRVLLFGGFDNVVHFADTWRWNGTSWQQLAPAFKPSARRGHAMAADGSGRVTLFGGIDAAGVQGDTWVWTGSSWQQQVTPVSPPARHRHAMATDPGGGVVLFGGFDAAGNVLDDTWIHASGVWRQRLPATVPPARMRHVMSFDVARQRVVMFGGEDPILAVLGDTWEWDGQDWIPRFPPLSPGARLSGGIAWDPAREETVLFGGFRGGPRPGTWLYAPQHRASYSAFGNGCPGTGGTPALGASSPLRPWLGSSFALRLQNLPPPGSALVLAFGVSNQTWGPVTLPLPLAVIGLPACTWFVSVELSFVLPTAGPSLVVPFVVPSAPQLLGKSFYNQAIVLDAGAPGFAAVSNAGVGSIGGK